jgi:hypothetical protein
LASKYLGVPDFELVKMNNPAVSIQSIKQYSGDRNRLIFRLAIVASIAIHVLLFFLLKSDFFKIDLKRELAKPAEPVTILFPENKPMKIVENINENNLEPDYSGYWPIVIPGAQPRCR